MKAFILAAGAGTRLRPLTYAIPKPMVPIVNKPVLEHVIENLRRHGIFNIVMNLHHYPQQIQDYFGTGNDWGVRIQYSYEKELMGTAGGVKKVEPLLDTTFIVMSGDGVTDIDLTKAIKFHKEKKSLATMVLKQIDAKFEYGVTLTDRSGRIKKFIEKPKWSDVFANTVNSGIYICEPEVLKMIPENQFYDFGMQVWPLLLKKRKRIYGYVMDEYWTDVGNLTEYRRSVHDSLDRKVKINIDGEQIHPGVWVGSGTQIESGARLESPCVIGQDCYIGKNVLIDKYTTVGSKSIIHQGAKIHNSILWNKVEVSRNVTLDNCIIGNQAKVSENITVFEGAVLNVDKR